MGLLNKGILLFGKLIRVVKLELVLKEIIVKNVWVFFQRKTCKYFVIDTVFDIILNAKIFSAGLNVFICV